jgi:hypothetical protein
MVRTYHTLVFVQHLIILAERDEEDEGSNILEAVYPLFSLASLTTDVEKLIGKLANLESGLGNACRLDTTPKDVLIMRHVTRVGHAIDSAKVVNGRVVQLELARTVDGLTDAGVPPETSDGIGDISREDVGLYLWG